MIIIGTMIGRVGAGGRHQLLVVGVDDIAFVGNGYQSIRRAAGRLNLGR